MCNVHVVKISSVPYKSYQVYLSSFAPSQDAGGMMTLTDAFCRLNRARGLELVSPDDLINAWDAIQ